MKRRQAKKIRKRYAGIMGALKCPNKFLRYFRYKANVGLTPLGTRTGRWSSGGKGFLETFFRDLSIRDWQKEYLCDLETFQKRARLPLPGAEVKFLRNGFGSEEKRIRSDFFIVDDLEDTCS